MASASFEPALSAVLAHEGGYSDHPRDPGGATMMGITQKALADWRAAPVTKDEVRALTRREAAAIYKARYWAAIEGDALPAGLDLALFDFAVNSGPDRAIRSLQKLLGVAVDGRIGPKTLSAAFSRPVEQTIRALCASRRGFLRRLPIFAVFARGWARRVHDIEARALGLAARAAPADPKPAPIQPKKDMPPMDLTKTLFSSRTIWANLIGLAALFLSWLGFDTSIIDKGALADSLLQLIAGGSFVASSVFRVIATRRLR